MLIIILDKSKTIASSLKKVLELFGYEVCMAIEEIYDIIFVPEKHLKGVIFIHEDDHESLPMEHPHILTAVSFWHELLGPEIPISFVCRSQSIVRLLSNLSGGGEDLTGLLQTVDCKTVQSMKERLKKRQIYDLKITDKLTKAIYKAYEDNHSLPAFDFASKTKHIRYLFYFLAWRFVVKKQMRFLIIDNKVDVLKKQFNRLCIYTESVGIPEGMSKIPGTPFEGDCIYFLDFDDVKKALSEKTSEKWGEAVREMFRPHSLRDDKQFPFDGIVLDISLGPKLGYTGIDILQALKNEKGFYQRETGLDNIPIVMLTGLSDEWHIIESINKNADWYIPKYKYKGQDTENVENILLESVKDIPITFYRLYLRRKELQKLFIRIFKVIYSINMRRYWDDYQKEIRELDSIDKDLKQLDLKNIPEFLSTFFQCLREMVVSAKSILDPGLASEDWVEVKKSGEKLLSTLDDISRFNDVYCFENYDRLKKYEESASGRDRMSVPFVDKEKILTRKEKKEAPDDDWPSLLSDYFKRRVKDIVRCANTHIRYLRPPVPREIM